MAFAGHHTVAETAAELGITPNAVRDAVHRGTLAAITDAIPGRILIPTEEIERYRAEVQGTQGWSKRKQPDYTPNTKQRTYQQTYYQRRKAARKQQPATEAAEKD